LLYCKFPVECDRERILKIGQYLTKLCVDNVGLLFWPTLYNVGTLPRFRVRLMHPATHNMHCSAAASNRRFRLTLSNKHTLRHIAKIIVDSEIVTLFRLLILRHDYISGLLYLLLIFTIVIKVTRLRSLTTFSKPTELMVSEFSYKVSRSFISQTNVVYAVKTRSSGSLSCWQKKRRTVQHKLCNGTWERSATTYRRI